MSFLRKLLPFRRAPKVVINPNDDFRQLTFIMHDAKALQSISDRQRRQLSEIRNVLVDSSSNVTSTLAKLKAIEDAAANSVEQFVAKASKMKMEELSLDSTAVTTQTNVRSNGVLSIFRKSKELTPSTNSLQLISTNTPKGYPLLPYDNMQLVLRLQLVKEYFSSLQGLLERSEISAKSLESSSKMIRLLDAVLLGTSSERIHEHMTLFGPQFFQYTMQTCFYSLYEAEIQALSRHLDKYPLQVKAHQKLLQKNPGSTYLLDSLELNTKLRCVLAWMDPNFFGGYRPLDDNFSLPFSEVLKGRKLFFADGEKVSVLYVEYLHGKVREYQNTKEEDRSTLRQGTYFILITILLDWLVCTI